jgi:NAD+ kinase
MDFTKMIEQRTELKRLKIAPKSKIAIVYRIDTPKVVSVAKEVAGWLKEKGFEPMTAPHHKVIKGTRLLKTKEDIDSLKLVIVLGGDGTYLRAAQLVDGRKIPVLGVNLGSLGFLTVIRFEDLFAGLEQIIEGHAILCPRAMMKVRLKRKNKIIKEWRGLNDVVIERGANSHLIDISIYISKNFVSNVKADGLIIASPTGSTAYNLAAGGPIMHPEVKAFVATPIAAHSLTNRPLLFPDNQEIILRTQSEHTQAKVIIDGQEACELKFGDDLLLARSKSDHYVVRSPNDNFFDILREKLRFGERA